MPTRTYQTNLRCQGCVGSIAPAFDTDARVKSWSADTSAPGKPLTVEGDLPRAEVEKLLRAKGYEVTGEVMPLTMAPAAPPEPPTSYFPLVLILVYLTGATLLAEYALGWFDGMRAMRHFMAGFFLVFSFFKLLDVRSFADSYRMYDLLAGAVPAYGLVYPFVEAGLGAAYLADLSPVVVNSVTLVVMGIGTLGVVRSLLARRKVKCACLGAVFNLPMSYVTLTEDLLMAGMAAAMLATG